MENERQSSKDIAKEKVEERTESPSPLFINKIPTVKYRTRLENILREIHTQSCSLEIRARTCDCLMGSYARLVTMLNETDPILTGSTCVSPLPSLASHVSGLLPLPSSDISDSLKFAALRRASNCGCNCVYLQKLMSMQPNASGLIAVSPDFSSRTNR
ncbi:hypothetical protein RRG08_023991 [Elysia crispata]|uniref:Uncharacterized protein n=1 Tax=Elysia crispata TaxID=231223 RepID=A0AAE0YMC2_9GAST|nr:hypothetical protein RRG08_023991 [Elysia crispata]